MTITLSPPAKDDSIDVVITRKEPNDRVGIVLDPEFTQRAIVKSVSAGTPSVGLFIPLDEIFAIDGVTCTSAKHCVALIRASNALEFKIHKSRRPVTRTETITEP